ncbi:hypothetical protein [Gymnodinialimonas hymeniacidonis]|uniref:hypothetical protein n=1 Tax=Gymnodinialimonas hymeniacidonis TaxID=3126508 RepID=UPI0034C60030
MLIRSILTIAVLGSFVFGAAANADAPQSGASQVVANTSPDGDFHDRTATRLLLATTR